MKTFKDELDEMARELHGLFGDKQSILDDTTIIDAYKQGAINNVKASIYYFELQSMKAVYEKSTVPNFREYFEEIKENIEAL